MLPEDDFLLPSDVAADALSEYESPKSLEDSPLRAWERAGRALNDPTQGMDYQDWTCYYVKDDKKIYLEAMTTGVKITLATVPYVREVSFAFNQNMQWNLVYKTGDGKVTFTWYNALTETHYTQEYYDRLITPKLTLDDSRAISSSNNDVILTYLRAGNLCIRKQRERFANEKILMSGFDKSNSILRFGMTKSKRLQWLMRKRVLV